jgi:hypothetical protein
MERIIKVTYNKFISGSNYVIEDRKYYTNNDTLEEVIESVRVEMQKLIDRDGGDIISITEDNT